MKSANDILTRVGAIKPNTLTEYLAEYLQAIELRVQKDLLNIQEPVYDASSLSLDCPEDTIYELYLFAVIDFLNGEYGRYENTLSAFTSAWEALVGQYTSKTEADSDDKDENESPDTENGKTDTENDNVSSDGRFKIW